MVLTVRVWVWVEQAERVLGVHRVLNTGCEADDEEAGSRDRNAVRRAVVWRVRTDRIAILEGIASVMLAVDSDSEGVKRAVTG